MAHLDIAKCRDCGADIVWKFDGGWVPYNTETMDDCTTRSATSRHAENQ